MSFAYGVQDYQISGGPPWVYSDRYDVLAKAPGAATRDQLLQMLQLLLESRFGLKLSHQPKELPVHVLSVAKGGLRQGLSPISAADEKLRASGVPPSPRPGTRDGITVLHMDMKGLAVWLSRKTGRVVIDRTGLMGRYDIALDWDRSDVSSPVGSDGPSLFTAVQEQLGLKLQSQKQAVEILVIDAADKPSAN